MLNKNQNKDLEQVHYDEDFNPGLPNNQDHHSSSLVFPPADAGPDSPDSPQITNMNSGLHDSQASSCPARPIPR